MVLDVDVVSIGVAGEEADGAMPAAIAVEVGIVESVEEEIGPKIPGESEGGAGPVVSEVGDGEGVDVAAAAATAVVDVGEAAFTGGPDPKLLDAVVEVPLDTSTFFTITMSPEELVTFTSTVAVPKPLECSKKLYGCLVVPCHVDPPSVLTSRLATALLALTTCMLNQYCDTPSLLCSSSGLVIGHWIYSQVVWMTPTDGFAKT
jgi:hypothetical protein